MLINHWIKHPELKREEELLVHLHHMRMGTSENLSAPMGLSFRTVRESLIPSLYKQNRKLILSHRLKDGRAVYYLGPEGCKRVSQIVGYKVNFYDYTGAQARHFEGINNIMGRLIKRIGIERFKYKTKWFFTRQARDMIQKAWSELLTEQVDQGYVSTEEAANILDELPEPDARFEILDKKARWLEFDNDTESRKKIERKMMDYVEAMIPMENQDVIIWVTTKHNPQRKDYLSNVWQDVKNSEEVKRLKDGYGDQFFLPSMHFFVEGEETDSILFL